MKIYKICLLLLLVAVTFFHNYILGKAISKLPESINFTLSQNYMPDKLWLHRCNSTDKQKEFYNKYNGLEFDIIYNGALNIFENSHDPSDALKYNLDNQLATYRELNKQSGIWLDFKNLNDSNKVQSFNKLNELIMKYNIDKSLIWVESKDWKSLRYFKDNGFKTSYYFPYYDFEKMDDKEIEDIKILTENIAASGNVDAISFDAKYYLFLKGINIPDNIVFLSWTGNKTWSEVWLRSRYQDILHDERVKVILVKDHGNYHR